MATSDKEEGACSLLLYSPWAWIVSLGAGAIGIYLFATHTGHVLAALPYLFLLACPLMHFFMHRRHSHHDHT
jgi:hypothetical protein